MLFESFAKPKIVALVDCNNFYVSCERVFRPDWQSLPVGVLSNNDGCIIARSNELKEAGIPMGAPYFKMKKQLQALNSIIVSSNYALYADMSSRVMKLLSQYATNFEVYSIDEAWLDLTDIAPSLLDEYGRQIVQTTHRSTGIPLAMGIGPTKVLAKLANRYCKKNKVEGHVFNIGSVKNIDELLSEVEVDDVWGIGKRWGNRLKAEGIHTALDLKNADAALYRKRFSIVLERIILELRGISCLGFESPAPKKGIVASRSFGAKVTQEHVLCQAVAAHASRAAEKLRAQGSVCGEICVWICSSRFQTKKVYYDRKIDLKFETPTADTRRIITAAKNGVAQIYRPGIEYAKAGVAILDIRQAEQIQEDMFAAPESAKSKKLMRMLDAVNQKYGKHSLYFAAKGKDKSWEMKREHKTPAYTTSWQDLPVVI